ncbi:hypothetical protein D3C80_1631070 [compost metagenome]
MQGPEAAVELAQGEALVAKVLLQRIANSLHQPGKRALPTKTHAQCADLGEQPQGRLEAGIAAVAHGQTDDPLVTLPTAGHAHVQRSQQHVEWRGLQPGSEVPHARQ